ncbi:MAG: preprotein translocase subunit SecE [Candidatus Atribacteria bacterium]|jgi:preprotein translocase subunit SecE|nr:preprotein translocase subunit SecE [Candidatus Atribacteria bacterium]
MKIKQIFQKLVNFIKEARAELKKVTWPNRKELISSTIVVMVAVVLVAIYLGLIDLLFSRVVAIILQ